MSWKDRIENTIFTIRTGDGKLYYPDWKNGEISKDYNASVFEFINQPGSLIDRKQPKANSIPLTFWFQGDDNIEQADVFYKSADDKRAWVVHHPFYGDINGQPISIKRDDSNYNCTEVTVDFRETILLNGPRLQITGNTFVQSSIEKFHTVSPIDYAGKVDLKPADVSIVTDNATKINNLIMKAIDATGYDSYITARNAMFNAVDNLILAPETAISTIHDVILQPSQFVTGVTSRIELLGTIYESIVRLVSDAQTKNNKAYFETAAGITIASLSNALLNPVATDYQTRGDVISAMNNLIDMYNDYLSILDASYVSSVNTATAFSASQPSQDALQDIVLNVLTNLELLAFNAKQERLVVLDLDSNLIVLTHKYIGLDVDDVNIETFRTINNIKNTGLFIIEKGTEIKYYA